MPTEIAFGYSIAPADGVLYSTNGGRAMKKSDKGKTHDAGLRQQKAPLTTPTDLKGEATKDIAGAMNAILADVFALYLKTKSFHWHISGRHFRDDHLLLDEHATQIFSMVDDIAERIRKIGGTALRSIGDIARNQRLKDNDDERLLATDMLRHLLDDNRQLTRFLRLAHEVCDRHRDVATASLIENWIDESERRAWFLSETTRER